MNKIKKSFAVVAALLLMSNNVFAFRADCFEEAYNDLDSFEGGLGFHLNAADATEYVNMAYAACFCLNNASHPLELEACFGTY